MSDAPAVTMIPEGATGSVRLEDHYDTDIADLWSAITDPERVARWIGTVEGDFRIGGELTARFTSSWEGRMRVEVCDAPHRLLVRSFDDEDGSETTTEALLSVEGDGTRLVVEERGLPGNALPSYGAGWRVHLEDLDALINGRPTSDWRTRWTELVPAYRDQV